ncbi:MAG: phytanoyl-CoA dioxygenase family protein [Abditibacteriales bacterium]|nr:phytanoyl-CoA dioxygenase family protein [Abditibacteriales bacterium]MDW8366278.1 phytanoyl-CoA dioxygenase family protein [Abditibacteriales bacterium]
MFNARQLADYRRDGYVVARGLFAADEVERLKEHYMALRRKVTDGVDPNSSDPLRRYPRMLQMHRWDETSLRWMIDPRLNACLTDLLGSEPFAVQTMIYFKPPGARGQALHQDQYYLRVQPGTCMAAWMAIDPCDEENGCLRVVPGTQNLPVLCTTAADTNVSFTDITVDVPADMTVVPVEMQPGDVLFFNGSLIHGSGPNVSRDRFRRALIGHYIVGEAEKVAKFYHPVLRMDGTEVPLGISEGGGRCGKWVERDGRAVVELSSPA